MNRTKIEEMLKDMKDHFNKLGGGSNYYIDEYSLDELNEWLTEKLTSLLAEDGGEVGEANDEEILSDMTYRSGARRVEQIRWYRKGFLDHKKLLSNSAPSNEASQHTKGDGV